MTQLCWTQPSFPWATVTGTGPLPCKGNWLDQGFFSQTTLNSWMCYVCSVQVLSGAPQVTSGTPATIHLRPGIWWCMAFHPMQCYKSPVFFTYTLKGHTRTWRLHVVTWCATIVQHVMELSYGPSYQGCQQHPVLQLWGLASKKLNQLLVFLTRVLFNSLEFSYGGIHIQ